MVVTVHVQNKYLLGIDSILGTVSSARDTRPDSCHHLAYRLEGNAMTQATVME